MSKDLQTAIDRITRLELIYIDAMNTLNVLKGIAEFEACHSHREDQNRPPHEHHSLLIAYRKFFDTARAAMLRDLHMQTAKLMLLDKDSLQVHRLIKHTHNRRNQIKRDLKPFSSEIISRDDKRAYYAVFYRGLETTDVTDLTTLLESYEHLIIKLALIRNKRLGHEDMTETSPNLLSLEELEDLLGVARKILDRVRSALGFGAYSENIRDYQIADHKTDTEFMLAKLYQTY